MAKAQASFKLEDRDRGYAKIRDELKKAGHGGAYVKVGLLGEAKDRREGDPVGTVGLGVIHEFGSDAANIPERSFLRRTVDTQREAWFGLQRQLAGLIYDGRLTIERALGLLGAKAMADVKATITEGPPIPPPNMPEVMLRKLGLTATGNPSKAPGAAYARKGFNRTGVAPRTLVDTGRLVASIAWGVVMGGGKKRGHGGGEQ
jgi:hypothetical protein